MHLLRLTAIVLVHGFVGWASCGAVMAIGMARFSMDTALVIHAMAVPIIFGVVSAHYFRKVQLAEPLSTAIAFVGIVVLLDVFIVALLIEGSFEMFTSPPGTWIPLLLIGLTTYLLGMSLSRRAAS